MGQSRGAEVKSTRREAKPAGEFWGKGPPPKPVVAAQTTGWDRSEELRYCHQWVKSYLAANGAETGDEFLNLKGLAHAGPFFKGTRRESNGAD